jgi:hypothetical protein
MEVSIINPLASRMKKMTGTRKTLLSVTIPAYDVESFVGASPESALRLPRADEMELIVMDDGSARAHSSDQGDPTVPSNQRHPSEKTVA